MELRAQARALIEQPPLTPARLDEAEELLQQAWSKDSSSAETASLMGDLLSMRHKSDAGTGRPGAPSSEASAEWYQRALSLDLDDVQALRGLATYHVRHWEPERALELLLRLRALTPGKVQVEAEIGYCYLLLHDYTEAERVLRAALPMAEGGKEVGERERIENLLAQVLMATGRDAEAESILSNAAEANRKRQGWGRTACPFVALGFLYRSRGDEGAAARELVTAADFQQPSSPIYDHEAAVACLLVGDFDEAERLVRRALTTEDRPEHRQLLEWIQRDRAEGAQGSSGGAGFERAVQAFQYYRFDDARAFIETALARESHPQFQVIAGLLASTRMDYDAAMAFAELARAGDPDEAGADVVEGHVLIARSEYDAARALLASAERQLRPELDRYVPSQQASGYLWTIYKMAQLGLGWCDANQERHEDALTHFDLVLRYQSDDRFALLGEANSLMGLGRLDDAQRVTDQLIALDPTNRYALTNQALLAYNMGDDAEAERLYQEALRDDTSRYTCPNVGLGLTFLRQGRTGEATEQFQSAIEREPDTDHTKYNGLAQIYIEEGRLDEAEPLLQKSLEILPQRSNEAYTLLDEIRALREQPAGAPPPR